MPKSSRLLRLVGWTRQISTPHHPRYQTRGFGAARRRRERKLLRDAVQQRQQEALLQGALQPTGAGQSLWPTLPHQDARTAAAPAAAVTSTIPAASLMATTSAPLPTASAISSATILQAASAPDFASAAATQSPSFAAASATIPTTL